MGDVLKVDIDSWDCDVARAALLRLSPKPRVVWIEINWSIPPPIRFARLYHPDWAQRVAALPRFPWTHGCSLSYAVDILKRFGYQLAALEDNDAVFLLSSRTVSQVPVAEAPECSLLAPSPLNEFEAFHRQAV